LLHEAGVTVDGDQPQDITVHDPRFYARVMAQGSLGLGESYMDGQWDARALDDFLFHLMQAHLDERVHGWRDLADALKARVFNLQAGAGSFEVGRRHYDLGNDLYEAMLGQRLVYSCGYWREATAMPQALLDKVVAAAKFNQGFATTEYLGAAMLDQRWHQIGPDQVPAAKDVMKFEAEALAKDGIFYAPVPPRYKTPYFSHIMGGYSAGYYAYIWSEVLDANTQKWFRENGGLSRKNGDHFRQTLLSKGGSVDAMELFQNFAGHEPQIEPLLEKRGLTSGGSKK